MRSLVAILGISILLSHPIAAKPAPSLGHCSVDKTGTEPPRYPDSLRGSGIQGIVLVEAVIGTNGCTESVTIVRKLPPELDTLAKQLVTSWKFHPAMKGDKPVKVLVRIEVAFKESGQ
jgi:TonB family protein